MILESPKSAKPQGPPEEVVTKVAYPLPKEKSQPRWSRSSINFMLDAGLLTAFLCLVWCGLMRRFVFPPAGEAAGWHLWGLDYAQWDTVQFACIVIMSVLVLIHLVLHWTWVCGVVATRVGRRLGTNRRPSESEKTLYGVCTLITVLVLLGGLLFWAEMSIRH